MGQSDRQGKLTRLLVTTRRLRKKAPSAAPRWNLEYPILGEAGIDSAFPAANEPLRLRSLPPHWPVPSTFLNLLP
jgi:hypothetical protein